MTSNTWSRFCCCLQSINLLKLTELLWFKAGGIEEEFGILIQSLVCNLPFTYTKHIGSQAEDKHVINQLTFFQLLLTVESPKFILFYLFPLFSFFSFIFLPSLQSPEVCISHFLFYITPLCSLQWKDRQAERQTDRQQGERHSQSKVTILDTHTLP